MNFPEDIQRHIFSFGYVEHRKYMKHLCEKLERGKVLQHNIDILVNEFNDGDNPSLSHLLKKVDTDILDKLFNQCVRCNCCTKHCNKRPIYIGGKTLSCTENYDVGCYCKCRQLSRFIQRSYDYYDGGYCKLNDTFRDQFV